MRKDSIGMFWRDEPVIKKTAAPKTKRVPPHPTWLQPDYLPGLAEAVAAATRMSYMTDDELIMLGNSSRPGTMVFDIEIYSNYFLAAFRHLETGRVCYVESDDLGTINGSKLKFIIEKFLTIGFNTIGFDLPICAMAIAGMGLQKLKDATQQIIVYQVPWRDVLKSYKVKQLRDINHIDLIEVAPLRGSLKIYGGRMHCRRMQDLPFHPDVVLSYEQIIITRHYCINDLDNTQLMYDMLKQQIELRVELGNQYGIDLRSKSDAQIAEYVITAEVAKLNGCKPVRPTIAPGTAYRFKTPDYMQYFQTDLLRNTLKIVEDSWFVVAEHGSIEMPPHIADLQININRATYTMGIGGLHSTEKKSSHVAGNGYELHEVDVTSYYPRIILNQKLFPHHLGANFLWVYNSLVEKRLYAKANKLLLIANSLKIVINGSFGKLGSKWSNLYAPDLLVQVTLTGQLTLLLLIEWLELNGIEVVSANTDGIVIKPHVSQVERMKYLIKEWERVTNFEMESDQYTGLYSRDVNSYMAVKTDGSVKTKGAFSNPWGDEKLKDKSMWLHKNPSAQICVEAFQMLLTKGVPIAETVRRCTDVTKFLSVRTVKGGAVQVIETTKPPAHRTKEELVQHAGYTPFYGGLWIGPNTEQSSAISLDKAYDQALSDLATPAKCTYLGKAIRWYYSTAETGELVYALSGNKVPKSDGAQPLMELEPGFFPADLDHSWYIKEAEKLLTAVGFA